MQLLKFFTTLSTILICVAATVPQKQVLITYPQDIPTSELQAQRNQITSAGGEILHEYHLIKGFIVKISAEALDSVTSLLQAVDKYKPVIEEDETVTIQR